MSTPPTSLPEAIAETLRGQILGGKYGPGDRLPSERDLAQRTGANRSSVREALKKLEQLGMITIGRGGARVAPIEASGLGALRHLLRSESPGRDLLAQWLDVYEIVMAGAARFAVERGTEEEFARAKELCRRLVAPSTTAEEYVATGDALTELIAVASRNVVLRMVRNALTAQAELRHSERTKLRASQKLLVPVVRDIERAMDERDPRAAEEGVRRLLRINREVTLERVGGPRSGH